MNHVIGDDFMNVTLETQIPTMKSKTPKPAKRKILLVDDDPAMLRVLFRLLVQEDFIVLTAANGMEALELVNITKFDLVLLDLKARLEDEWATLRQLSTQNPLLPVVLITDRANQFFYALASDICALLEKPLNFIKLIRTIHSLFGEPIGRRHAHFCRPVNKASSYQTGRRRFPKSLESELKLNQTSISQLSCPKSQGPVAGG